MKTVLFQGDSITDAARSRENDNHLGAGYATMVAGALGAEKPGTFRFVNRGVGGNKIVDLMSRVEYDVIDVKPDYLSVLIGTNDLAKEELYRTDPGAVRFETLYNIYLDEIRGALPDVKIMLMGPYIFKGTGTEAKYDAYKELQKVFDAAVMRVAGTQNLPYVSLDEVFTKAAEQAPDSYWSYDGWHPTACGHELIKRAWLQGFAELQGK